MRHGWVRQVHSSQKQLIEERVTNVGRGVKGIYLGLLLSVSVPAHATIRSKSWATFPAVSI